VSEILRATGVSYSYRGAATPAVLDVELVVAPGAAVGIVGESGSGKTTLGRLLVGGLRPTAGEVVVRGRAWSTVHRRDPERRSVQMVF
jgi:peptide/nickel transport system ATP-binding protein